MTKPRKEIDLLIDLTAAIARNDTTVRGSLANQRNGHPGSRPPHHIDAEGNGPPAYPDPTGEWAITPDTAAMMLRRYYKREKVAIRALEDMDAIARMALPTEVDRAQVADPNDWCHNCLPHGYCNPRTKDGGRYCKWCRTIQQAWGFLPPSHILQLHEHGDKAKIEPALKAHKKGKK